jgi:hypothetical protein
MSYTPQNAWNQNPQTGLTSNPGPFLAEVMRNDDPLYSARLLVYIPDMGGDPTQESSWHLVRYMTPYYGIQPLSNRLAADPADPSTLQSYGMWMTPPDVGIKVLVMFINGDRSRGVWIGCLPEIGSHAAMPGQDAGDFDIYENYSAANSNIQGIARPPHSTAATFETQGLAGDNQRGPISSSSLRESPSRVFGFNTPGSHSFVMDDGAEDGTNKIVRIRTASGNQIMMNDDSGFVYIINAAGTGWVELSPSGHVDVYGEAGLNMATKGSINMHADENINIHAGQHIKIVAQVGAKIQGTEEMQIHGGRLWLEGVDSIEQHSCGQIKLTGFNGMFFKSFDNFVLQGKCFKWNSGTALEAEQVPPEETEQINGYTTTVKRAPNAEPWEGHEDSNSSPSSVFDQTVGTPLAIPPGGTIADLLPDSVSRVPGTSAGATTEDLALAQAVSLTPEQIALRARVDRPGPTYQGPSGPRNSIVDRAITLTPEQIALRARVDRSGPVYRGPGGTRNSIVDRAVPLTLDDIVSIDPRLLRTGVTTPGTSRTAVPIATNTGRLDINSITDSDATNISATVGILGGTAESVAGRLSETVRQATTEIQLTVSGGLAATLGGVPAATENPALLASAAFDNIAGQQAFSSIPALSGGGNTGYFSTGDNCARPVDGGFGQSVGPQGGGGAFSGAPSNIVPPAALANDPEWQTQLAALKQEFPQLDEQELYRTIQGESRFNSTVVNSDSGATGLFQFIPSTAAGLGTSTGEIQNMTPAQQLEVYGRYLRQSDYRGGPLGMIQAAPGTYRNLIRQFGNWPAVPRNTEVYTPDTAAWRQNPGWRGPDGKITIGSIEAYYAKQ